jgi:hypothetical protein
MLPVAGSVGGTGHRDHVDGDADVLRRTRSNDGECSPFVGKVNLHILKGDLRWTPQTSNLWSSARRSSMRPELSRSSIRFNFINLRNLTVTIRVRRCITGQHHRKIAL